MQKHAFVLLLFSFAYTQAKYIFFSVCLDPPKAKALE